MTGPAFKADPLLMAVLKVMAVMVVMPVVVLMMVPLGVVMLLVGGGLGLGSGDLP